MYFILVVCGCLVICMIVITLHIHQYQHTSCNKQVYYLCDDGLKRGKEVRGGERSRTNQLGASGARSFVIVLLSPSPLFLTSLPHLSPSPLFLTSLTLLSSLLSTRVTPPHSFCLPFTSRLHCSWSLLRYHPHLWPSAFRLAERQKI